MDADSLICSLGRCKWDSHTVHQHSQQRLTAYWLAPQENDCSLMRIKSPLTGRQVASQPLNRFSRYSKWLDTSRRALVSCVSGRHWHPEHTDPCTVCPWSQGIYNSVSQPLWDRGPVNYFFKRRGPGPNRFTRKYLSIFLSSYIKLTYVLIINYGIIIKNSSTIMCKVWHVDKYKITFKLVINYGRSSRGPVWLMPGPGTEPRPGGWETLIYNTWGWPA